MTGCYLCKAFVFVVSVSKKKWRLKFDDDGENE